MNRMEIEVKVREVLGEVVDIEGMDKVASDSSLVQEFGLNSMDAISILVAIEDEFDIEIDDQDLSVELVKTIDSLTNYIAGKKA